MRPICVVALSALFGLAFWVVDATLDYLLVRQGTWWGLLIADIPPREMYVRLIELAFPLALGMAIALILITRRRAAGALLESEERLRTVFETAEDCIFIKDRDLHYAQVNPATARLFGLTVDEVLSRSDAELFGAEAAEEIHRSDRRVLDGEALVVERTRVLGGVARTFHISKVPLRSSSGKIVGLYGIARDITRRKLAEDALQHERDRAQQYLDVAGVMFVALDAQGRVTLVNQLACKILGKTDAEIVGLNWSDNFVPQCERQHTRAVYEQLMAGKLEPVEYFENPIQTATGEPRLISWHNTVLRDEAGRICGTLSSGEDITERRRAEEERSNLEGQLRQAQKMEAIGRLAGGVAHDFNNVLTAILGHAELVLVALKQRLPADDPLIAALRQIDRATQRGAALTRQLLAFSRRQITRPEVLDPNRAVANMQIMLQRLVGEDIRLEFELAADCGHIRIDAGQLEQVVMNLVLNARDAVSPGGQIHVETRRAASDDYRNVAHVEALAEAHVLLSVRDNGCGMDAATLERIFEPFFTTKLEGEGTGLGLATVYGIVEQAGGAVNVRSEAGQGSTFEVFLPLVSEPASAPQEPPERESPPWGTETVLVCEDDDLLRRLAVQMLECRGYTVLAAANGDEALALSKDNAPIDLLITDVVMPGMNGRQLADALTANHGVTKVMFVSGYTADVIIDHGVEAQAVEFLEKPFSWNEFLLRVRQILDSDKDRQDLPNLEQTEQC
ncbi:MAG: PAS domain S-box protein [Planctomycetes bacterium]|nr:PAS domain S-box protein [Planctomycetota bacterium]